MTDYKYKKDYIKYRLERAKSTFKIAKLAADAKEFNSCTNRLYYAAFYAVNALLLKYDYSSSKHTSLKILFNQHFVKTGIIPKEYGELYNDLFEFRQESDYKDLFYANPDDIIPLLPKVDKFIEFISELIEKPKT